MRQVAFFLAVCASTLFAQPGSYFKIVFSAEPKHCTPAFLDSVKSWGGTGVSIFVRWWMYQNPGRLTLHTLDPCVRRIIDDSLDVYIRVVIHDRPGDVAVIQPETHRSDYWLLSNNEPLRTGLDAGGWQLNISSSWSTGLMRAFYDSVLVYAKSWRPAHRVKEFIPSISPAAEFEYDSMDWVDYSDSALARFRDFLHTKYATIDRLRAVWGAGMSDFAAIDPRGYHWEYPPGGTVSYAPGRIDWIVFRTTELKRFFDTLAADTHRKGMRIAFQFGSLYDSDIERRGWVDPTSLVENADLVISDEVFEYKPQFAFVADYVRSMCTYWNVTRNDGMNRTFGTESNWPGYHGAASARLCNDWIDQLKKSFDRGASMLSISGWDGEPDRSYAPQGKYKNAFDVPWSHDSLRVWRNILVRYGKTKVKQTAVMSRAIHLGCERQAYMHNPHETSGVYDTFDIFNSLISKYPYTKYPGYDGRCDIVTNEMLARTPSYINRYKSGLWFTESSDYISEKAYQALVSKGVKSGMRNSTYFEVNSLGRYRNTPGSKNEYGTERSPTDLDSRTR